MKCVNVKTKKDYKHGLVIEENGCGGNAEFTVNEGIVTFSTSCYSLPTNCPDTTNMLKSLLSSSNH